jgi:hypothetical protein
MEFLLTPIQWCMKELFRTIHKALALCFSFSPSPFVLSAATFSGLDEPVLRR